ncbi:hypothetical protein I7I51_06866 [Histoplasma capsulatum]|uniref:Uncharacterized protein n=1 Tax=Ajellomyces capsulatus TaxID=5037 RepID=A0A8A1MJG4_AJECA|nr:hypothetical protein I7I51_06866 [Histoplasma capsulatum]
MAQSRLSSCYCEQPAPRGMCQILDKTIVKLFLRNYCSQSTAFATSRMAPEMVKLVWKHSRRGLSVCSGERCQFVLRVGNWGHSTIAKQKYLVRNRSSLPLVCDASLVISFPDKYLEPPRPGRLLPGTSPIQAYVFRDTNLGEFHKLERAVTFVVYGIMYRLKHDPTENKSRFVSGIHALQIRRQFFKSLESRRGRIIDKISEQKIRSSRLLADPRCCGVSTSSDGRDDIIA